jgi:hypothetical protein
VSILAAVLIVTISVGVSDRPPTAPPGPFDKQLRAFNNPTFAEAFLAVVNIRQHLSWSSHISDFC